MKHQGQMVSEKMSRCMAVLPVNGAGLDLFRPAPNHSAEPSADETLAD